MKRGTFALFALFLSLAGCGYNAPKGDGSLLKINSLQEFKDRILNRTNSTLEGYELTVDLDFGGETLNPNSVEKKVIFDGLNHTISNFKILGSANAGLFGNMINSTFRNIVIDNVQVTGTSPGALASKITNTSVENVTVTSTCKIGDGSEGFSGGIVGFASTDSTITRCKNYAEVKGGNSTGGIAGKLYNSSVNNCENYGNITGYGDRHVGGITGFIEQRWDSYGVSHPVTQNNNKNYGTINGREASRVGGIIGGYTRSAATYTTYSQVCTFTNNENHGLVKGADNIGGIIGGCTDAQNKEIKVSYCNNYGTVTGNENIGGIVGSNVKNMTISQSKNIYNNDRSNYVSGYYDVGGICGLGHHFEFCENAGLVKLEKKDGAEDKDSYDHHKGQYGVGGICGNNFTGEVPNLKNCINSGDVRGYSVGGQQYATGTSIGGLAGILVGGTVQYCESTGTVSGNNCVGGLIGALVPGEEAKITNCTFTGSITGADYKTAGLIGYIYAYNLDHSKKVTISECTVDSNNLFGYGQRISGLVGSSYISTEDSSYYGVSKIFDCVIKGTIHAITGQGAEVLGSNPVAANGTKYINVLEDTLTIQVSIVKS